MIELNEKDGTQPAGTGWYMNDKGYITTVDHVVHPGESAQIFVSTVDGPIRSAHFVGSDPEADIAVLKVDAIQKTPYLRWGNSDNLQILAPLYMDGNALDRGLGWASASVAALHRERRGWVTDFLQLNVPTCPGTSGSLILNSDGLVVGILDSIAHVMPFSPIGLAAPTSAIPSNTVSMIANYIIKHGNFISGNPDFTFDNATKPNDDFPFGQKGRGAVITNVDKGSCSEQNGFLSGDIVIGFDKDIITNKAELEMAIHLTHPGETHNVRFLRQGIVDTRQLLMDILTPSSQPLPLTHAALSRPSP